MTHLRFPIEFLCENDDYFNSQCLKGLTPKHNSCYSVSATSFKTPTKLIPKSILKEFLNSGSKGEKNIRINEALNVDRKISSKNGLSDYYLEKRPRIHSPGERDTCGQRSSAKIGGSLEGRYGERPIRSVMSLEQRNIEKKHKNNINTHFELQEQNNLNQSKATASFETNVNMGDIYQEGFSEYQKAYVRKLQRERELEIYSHILFKLNSNQRREDYMRKSNPKIYLDSRIKDQRERRNNFFNSSEGKLSARGPNSNDTWSSGKFPNLNHIEDKIYELEKSLDKYSRKLRASIVRQQDHLLREENRKRDYEDFENSNLAYKKRKTNIVSEHNGSKTSKSHSKNSVRIKENNNQQITDQASTKKSSFIRKYRSPKTNKNEQRGINQELEFLREENENLKQNLHSQESKNSKPQKQRMKDILNQETELLKVIDHIKYKLHKSIMKESVREPKSTKQYRQSKRTSSHNKKKIQKLAKSKKLCEIIKSKDVNSERVYMTREAYGAKKLERENAATLYQGLSTTYNGFHWNSDQALKINKNLY